MEKSMEKIDFQIDLLEAILHILCPIVQLMCMIFAIFICENSKIETCIIYFQLFLFGIQLFLPKLLRRFVMKKQSKELIEKNCKK
jgi:hypothetical protein